VPNQQLAWVYDVLFKQPQHPGVANTATDGTRAATLAAHPFQAGPNGIDEVVLRVAMRTPHRLVLALGVLQTH